MKGLAKMLLIGAGATVIGAGSLQGSLAGASYSNPDGYSKSITYEGSSNSGVTINYSGSEPANMIPFSYKSYNPKHNETFLEDAKKIDANWGKKYRARINEDYWLEQTKGIIDGDLAYAIGIKESSANPKAVHKDSGARGFWQIMEKTWQGYTPLPFDKAFDFQTNQKIAAKNFGVAITYLENNIPYWDRLSLEEKRQLAIVAHNWGQGSVVSHLKRHNNLNRIPFESRDMLDKVFSYSNYLEEQKKIEEYLNERNNFQIIDYLDSKKPNLVEPFKPN